MKFFALAVLALAALAQANPLNEWEVNSRFEQFKAQFGRNYVTVEEERFRKQAFAENLAFITEHNRLYAAGIKKFTVDVNNFADWTRAEMKERNGFKPNFNRARNEQVDPLFGAVGLPATVDWRTKGVVTPIKNQEQCGSCWAFSAVASIEGQHALKTGNLVSLSEQNLMDCSGPQGDNSCEGGLMDDAFTYVIQNNGIDTEASYPYQAVDEPSCSYKRSNRGATIASFVDVTQYSEAALKVAVATIGPISVAIDASQPSFNFYNGTGVYDEPNCSSTQLDHGVTAVGYGTLNGTPYWLVKNSWGTSWGGPLNGYIYMSRNLNNQCGIATMASYPQV